MTWWIKLMLQGEEPWCLVVSIAAGYIPNKMYGTSCGRRLRYRSLLHSQRGFSEVLFRYPENIKWGNKNIINIRLNCVKTTLLFSQVSSEPLIFRFPGSMKQPPLLAPRILVIHFPAPCVLLVGRGFGEKGHHWWLIIVYVFSIPFWSLHLLLL